MAPKINAVPRKTKNGQPRSMQASWGSIALLAALPASPVFSSQYILRSNDPTVHGYKQFVVPRLLKSFSNIMPMPTPETRAMQARTARCVVPKRDSFDHVKMRRFTIPPAPADWLIELATSPPNGEIQPVEQYGFVFTPKSDSRQGDEKAKKGEKIVLYFHGGGYSTGHPTWTALPGKISRDTGLRVWGGQYRKCLDVHSAWPAPLVDALAHWVHSTTVLGFEPSSIVLMGDSAGGHLCLSLTQQLLALGKALPGGLALSSPWSDSTFSQPSWKWKDDYLGLPRLERSIDSLSRFFRKEDSTQPIFSPAFAPEGHWKQLADIPVFIALGTKEALHDEVQSLVKGMRRDGVNVASFEDKDQSHCAPLVAGVMAPEDSYMHFAEGVKGVTDQVEGHSS